MRGFDSCYSCNIVLNKLKNYTNLTDLTYKPKKRKGMKKRRYRARLVKATPSGVFSRMRLKSNPFSLPNNLTPQLTS